MTPAERDAVGAALGGRVLASATLAGGFSHETCLVTLSSGRVVARFGGADPAVEAAVMTAGRTRVPVPEVLAVLPGGDGRRPAMVIAYVDGTPLSDVLDAGPADPYDLGAEVGSAVARIGAVTFARPGFFTGPDLAVGDQPPWSEQLPGMVGACMEATTDARLTPAERRAWLDLCTAHAPALRGVDHEARLVHADVNPKNILVSRSPGGWRVDAALDWEFAYSGCPAGDAANMLRFGADYPAGYVTGFRAGFGDDRAYPGRVLDMFALSDLVTRPAGNPVADRAARVIRNWLATGVPRD